MSVRDWFRNRVELWAERRYHRWIEKLKRDRLAEGDTTK